MISFIAIPVWDQHNRAEDAARTEAAAYRDMYEAVEDSDVAEKASLQRAVRNVIDFLAVKEWPQMAHLRAPRVTAPPVRELRVAIHSIPEGSSLHTELHDLFRQATDARESRLRIAAYRPPPARWGIVGILALLTQLGVGLIHAESYRARRIALGMVSVGIACCFVILFAYTRPYLGQFAIKPTDLIVLSEEIGRGDISLKVGEIRR